MNGFGFPLVMGMGGYSGAGYVQQPHGGGMVQDGGNKPANFRDGDWLCTSCNSHNYATRQECRDCRASKGGGNASSRHRSSRRSRSRSDSRDHERGSRGRDYSRSRSRDRGERDNSCFAYQRGECNRGSSCRFEHKRSGGGRSSDRGRDSDRRDGERDNSCFAYQRGECNRGDSCRFEHRRSGGGRGRSSDRRDGERDNTCFAYQRGECNRGDSCRFEHRRSGGGRGGERDNSCFAFQKGQCDRGDSCRFEHTLSGNGGRPVSLPRGAMRVGDWWCNSCNVLKYAFRDVCTTCNSVKDDAAEAKIAGFLEYVRTQNLPVKFLPGDWVCAACSDHVFARKEKCGKCEAERPEASDPELVRLFGEEFLASRRKAAVDAAPTFAADTMPAE